MNDALNIDLHTHSTCSDGALKPADLVAAAAAAGVEVLALTDHDTVAGLETAAAHAARLGLRLVPGVEISAAWRSQGIHVLGLWIDPADGGLRRALDAQAARRHERMRRICARLGEMHLPGDQLLRAVLAHPGLPSRTHLAAALVAGGHVRSTQQAFRRFLGRGKAADIAADWPALDDVIGWIRSAGGVAALAHPARYPLSAGARRRLLADFAGAGGTALEVITGGNSPHTIDACAQLALNHGLEGSVGSDFHDPDLAWNRLGRSLKLPASVAPVWRKQGL
jgi:predicted metal-dependent phosphoesterase TrpH